MEAHPLRRRSTTTKFATPFGSLFAPVEWNDSGQAVGFRISAPQRRENSATAINAVEQPAISKLLEAIGDTASGILEEGA